MSEIQYVGARYVPKFSDPITWQGGKSYEALTIVTFNNSSYTSKKPVPANVGNPAQNPEYWVLTGNYNGQVEQYREEVETLKTVYISEPEGTDITDLINNGLATGNVVLDGKSYKVNTITMPDNKFINGNGSTLTYIGASLPDAFLIHVGTTHTTTTENNICGLSNLEIRCNDLINGVLVLNREVKLNNVEVTEPAHIGFQIGNDETENISYDCNVVDCYVRFIKLKTFATAYSSKGFDNFYQGCRMVNAVTGFELKSGDSCVYCHAFCRTNDDGTDVGDGTVGFITRTGNVDLSNCVADECQYGVTVQSEVGGNLNLSNYMYTIYTPQNTSRMKHALNFNFHDTINASGLNILERGDVIHCSTFTDLAGDFREFSNFNINFRPNVPAITSQDLCNIAFFTDGKPIYVPWSSGTNRIAIGELTNLVTNQYSFNNFVASYYDKNISIENISGMFTHDGSDTDIFSYGTVSGRPGRTVTTGTAVLDGKTYLFIQDSAGGTPQGCIKLQGVGIRYVNHYIDLSNATVQHSSEFTI